MLQKAGAKVITEDIGEKTVQSKNDIDYSLIRSYGDRELIDYLISNFSQSTPMKITELKKQIESKANTDIKRTLHGLKNLFGNVGAHNVAAHCQYLEDLTDNEGPEFIGKHVPDLERQYFSIRGELIEFLQRH